MTRPSIRERAGDGVTWPCAACGHKHYASEQCADHQWTDFCPYEGLDCPSNVAELKAAEEAELVARYGENPSLEDLRLDASEITQNVRLPRSTGLQAR